MNKLLPKTRPYIEFIYLFFVSIVFLSEEALLDWAVLFESISLFLNSFISCHNYIKGIK